MMKTLRRVSAFAASFVLFATMGAPARATTTPLDGQVPRYDHILVIVEENKDYSTIMEGSLTPNIMRLAKTYGTATQMFGERHPSQPNYVAMLGGDTFGVADDHFPDIVDQPNLGTQLRAKGLDWRAYLEDLPAPGWIAGAVSPPPGQYAAKHTGFTNFKSTHDMSAPELAKHLVAFDALHADLKSGNVPAFAFVIPNLCNEMHGADACPDQPTVIARGDAVAGALVAAIQASPIWTTPGKNTAIVITWDEDGSFSNGSCCVKNANNPGGGHVATVVVTNHGPSGVVDATPYDHYSLLRTIEDAFGLAHLAHADDATVLPMVPLFTTSAPSPRPRG